MMNRSVPDFESDEDYLITELPEKSTMGGNEDIMELMWHNGQVVMQSQNQRTGGNKKPEMRPPAPESREIRSSVVEEEAGPSNLFIQEDEMASWLHYPIDDVPFEGYLYNNDLLYPTPPSSAAPVTAAATSLPPPPPPSVMIPPTRPPVPPFRRVENESGQPKYTNFMHFSRPNKSRNPESGPSSLQPSTIVASNDTPAVEASESRASRVSDKPAPVSVGNIGGGGSTRGVGAVGTSSPGKEIETCDASLTSSPGSGVDPLAEEAPPPTDDRKRKGREIDDTAYHIEDNEFEDLDAKKQSQIGSTSTKRSRAAEVHNLSERKRRDRINEKMKALQELIPRCNKSDKASMLDEAIKYLKSLQMQVQMMSMGCSMVPMMFPGVQQFIPPIAMGMNMGMGMGMDMNRPMVPFHAILQGSPLPNPGQPGQRFPVPGFNMPPVNVAGPTLSQPLNTSSPMMSSLPLQNQNQPRAVNLADPFRQYVRVHQPQLSLPQTQGSIPPFATKPSTSKDVTNTDHNQTG